MDEKPIFMGLTVYRERGAYLQRLEQYDKAKDAYTQAYQFCPEDVRMLTGRSQSYGDALITQLQASDAEQALKIEPPNMNAKKMQAHAMYLGDEYEKSVVLNHRGYRLRKQPTYFREGIDQGLETIQDCIGENAGNVMLDFLPLIKKNKSIFVDENEPQKTERVSRIPKQENVKKLTQIQVRRNNILSRVLAMKYLGPIAYDKFFLQELQKDSRLRSANTRGSEELKKLVNDAIATLIKRQELMRSQRPYYTIKLAEKVESKRQNKYKESLLIKEREVNIRTADSYITAIDKCLQENHIKDLMTKAERMQIFLDTKTSRTLPGKEGYIDLLYKAVGAGYLSQYRLSYTLSERSNRRRVAFLMGMKVGRPSSFDSVMATYPYKFNDVNTAIDKVAYTLDTCENAMMKCFLQYELSRLLCQQKNYAHAKYYAKLVQYDAIELKNAVWWINGCLAMMSGDMQQGNANDVCGQVEEALEWASKLPQSERMQAFLLKCKEMVLDPEVVDDRKLVVKREKEILHIMDDRTRVDAGVLFKRMSTIPPLRQFSVLPHPMQINKATDRRKYKQRRLTVVPGPEKELPRPPVSKTLGFQILNY